MGLAQQVPGGLPVGQAHQGAVLEGQGGEGGQGALAAARVVGQGAPLQEQAHGPHGQLVGDQERLVSLGRGQGGGDGAAHAGDDVAVGLAPGGAQGVEVEGPVLGAGQDAAVSVDGEALEAVVGLDEAGVGGGGQSEGRL